MQESILAVKQRTEKPKVLRKKGILPGVLYGDKFEDGLSVEFDKSDFKKIISKHGSSAKLSVELDGTKKLGIIKDIQKDPINQEIIHVDLFMISETSDLRMKIPVIFTGVAVLERNEWILQTYNSRIDISGKPSLIPESITIDVSEKQLRDSIKVSDLNLAEGIRIHNDPEEILASVTEVKFKAEEVVAVAEEGAEEGAEGAETTEAKAGGEEKTEE